MEEELEFEDQRPHEKIIFLRHQHPWVLAKAGLVVVILAVVVIISFLIWGASFNSVVTLIAALIIAGIYIWIRAFLYKNGLFILTNERIINICQNGIFRRQVQETELENIYNLQYKVEGPIGSLLNFGSIELTTQGDLTNIIKVQNIENPHFIFEKISDAKKRVLNQRNIQ